MSVGRGQFRGPVYQTSMVPGPMVTRYSPRFTSNARGGYQMNFYIGSPFRPSRNVQYVRPMEPPLQKRQHLVQIMMQSTLTSSSQVSVQVTQTKLSSPCSTSKTNIMLNPSTNMLVPDVPNWFVMQDERIKTMIEESEETQKRTKMVRPPQV